MAESSKLSSSRTNTFWKWGLAIFALQVFFFIFLRYDSLFGQDSYGYLNDANALIVWMKGGAEPPDFFWTRGYSAVGALLGMPFDNAHLPLTLISILSHIALTFVCMRWAEQLYPGRKETAGFIGLSVAFSPFLFRNGITIQSDMLAIFWGTFGAWQSHRLWVKGEAKHLIWAAFGLGYAVATRYAMIPLVFPPALALVWKCSQIRKWHWTPLLLLAFLPFIPEWFIFPDATATLRHGNVMAWNPLNFFRREFQNMDGHSIFSYPNLVYMLKAAWHPGVLGVGMVAWLGFIFGFKARNWKPTLWLLIPPALYLLLIGGLPYQNDRFLLPLAPWLALFLFPSWEHLMDKVMDQPYGQVLRRIGSYFVIGLALMLAIRAPQAMVARSWMEREVAWRLSSNYPGQRVYTLSAVAMLTARCPDLEVISLFDDSIPTPQPGDLVLSDFHRTFLQWKDLPAGKHWTELEAQFPMDTLEYFEPEWYLYGIR